MAVLKGKLRMQRWSRGSRKWGWEGAKGRWLGPNTAAPATGADRAAFTGQGVG